MKDHSDGKFRISLRVSCLRDAFLCKFCFLEQEWFRDQEGILHFLADFFFLLSPLCLLPNNRHHRQKLCLSTLPFSAFQLLTHTIHFLLDNQPSKLIKNPTSKHPLFIMSPVLPLRMTKNHRNQQHYTVHSISIYPKLPGT
uniref:Uncharacterized protein n=1 Tax=Populus trichocarpa TaxID=3694 RepID=A0A2K1YK05_POPTR